MALARSTDKRPPEIINPPRRSGTAEMDAQAQLYQQALAAPNAPPKNLSSGTAEFTAQRYTTPCMAQIRLNMIVYCNVRTHHDAPTRTNTTGNACPHTYGTRRTHLDSDPCYT